MLVVEVGTHLCGGAARLKDAMVRVDYAMSCTAARKQMALLNWSIVTRCFHFRPIGWLGEAVGGRR